MRSNAFQMELTHMGLDLIVEDLNAISDSTVMLRYPDGLERESYVLLAGTIQDQVEMDKLCCEGPQLCKQCSCPKDRLHEAYARFPPRDPIAVEKAVRDAALNGGFQATGVCPASDPCSLREQIPRARDLGGFPLLHAPQKSTKIRGSC